MRPLYHPESCLLVFGSSLHLGQSGRDAGTLVNDSPECSLPFSNFIDTFFEPPRPYPNKSPSESDDNKASPAKEPLIMLRPLIVHRMCAFPRLPRPALDFRFF